MFFEPLHGWGLNHCPGQPVPMPDHSFSKEIFPNIKPKPPLTQPEAISSRPIAGYLGDQHPPHYTLLAGSCRERYGLPSASSRLNSPSSLSYSSQDLFSRPFTSRTALSLDILQHLTVLLAVRGPKPNTVLQVQPHQCRVQGHNHCPTPGGHTLPYTSQDAADLFSRPFICFAALLCTRYVLNNVLKCSE